MKISVQEEQCKITEVLDKLNILEPLRGSVLKSYGQMLQPGQTHDGQLSASIAALLFVLSFERHDAETEPEYMRIRAITQDAYYSEMCPEGYAATFGGEPEFYGLINALTNKLLDVFKAMADA